MATTTQTLRVYRWNAARVKGGQRLLPAQPEARIELDTNYDRARTQVRALVAKLGKVRNISPMAQPAGWSVVVE